jgi:hypothetical protein
VFDDTLQRAFTDDGHGNGRLTPEGVGFFDMRLRPSGKDLWVGLALHPAIGLLVPSRQDLAREYAHIARLASANLKLPIRNANWQNMQDVMNESRKSLRDRINPISVWRTTPDFSRMQATAEQLMGYRDGILVAIAAEMYHREHGEYPENLNALVPSELSAIPADRITGEPIRYRIIDGRPVVYSVGADRKDDGGRAVPAYKAAAWEPSQAVSDGDWVLYPTN